MPKRGLFLVRLLGLLCANAVLLSAFSPAQATDLPKYPSDHRDVPVHDPGDGAELDADYGMRGVTVKFDLTQHVQSVLQGGDEDATTWGSRFDTSVTVDGKRIGLWTGFYIDIEVQTRLGDSINADTGTVLPMNFDLSFPAAEEQRVAIPLFRFRQQVTDNLLFFIGRVTPLPGYTNAFAAGVGKSQFSNTALVAKPVMSGALFPSAYTAGFSYQFVKPSGPLDRGSALKFFVQDANDVYSTDGFDTLFENGYSAFGELLVSTKFFGLPGQQTVNFAWSNRTRTSLSLNDAVILPGEGEELIPGEKDFTWTFFYGFDQYFWYDPDNPRRGFGAFGHFSISDGNPNPIYWFFNIGLGGTGPLPSRPQDKWGIGYFQTEFSDDLQASLSELLDLKLVSEQGIEAFYSFSLNSNVDLTIDLQHVEPGVVAGADDWVTVGGVRLRTRF